MLQELNGYRTIDFNNAVLTTASTTHSDPIGTHETVEEAPALRNDEAMRKHLFNEKHVKNIENFKQFKDKSLRSINGSVIDELDLILNVSGGENETYVTGQVIIDNVIHRIVLGKYDEVMRETFYPYYTKWATRGTRAIVKHLGPDERQQVSKCWSPNGSEWYMSFNTSQIKNTGGPSATHKEFDQMVTDMQSAGYTMKESGEGFKW